ncbi:MAG: hypothetical protein M1829_005061 [Trizodia sp. TS-e1964]|nr:MAG: hypothetical protein M1829_005061 [Trizodia sp. TS-e1964]
MTTPTDLPPPKPSVRNPPPTLFSGPPSQNNSRVSLHSILIHPPSAPSIGASSIHPPSTRLRTLDTNPTLSPTTLPVYHTPAGAPIPPDTDAQWAETQASLAEVELSASRAHVFGAAHARALEELRAAQIALAQAWARSEGDEDERGGRGVERGAGVGVGGMASSKSRSPAERPGSGGEEVVARQRREANDRYFGRVNGGVLDVVAKLEDVAAAMRGVERETSGFWREGGRGNGTASSSAASSGG